MSGISPQETKKNSFHKKIEPIPRLDIQALFLSTLTADKSSKKWPLQSSTTSCFHYDRTNIVVVIICLLFFLVLVLLFFCVILRFDFLLTKNWEKMIFMKTNILFFYQTITNRKIKKFNRWFTVFMDNLIFFFVVVGILFGKFISYNLQCNRVVVIS